MLRWTCRQMGGSVVARARALNCRPYLLNSRSMFAEARTAAPAALEILDGVDDPHARESWLIVIYATALDGTPEVALASTADAAVRWARGNG